MVKIKDGSFVNKEKKEKSDKSKKGIIVILLLLNIPLIKELIIITRSKRNYTVHSPSLTAASLLPHLLSLVICSIEKMKKHIRFLKT